MIRLDKVPQNLGAFQRDRALELLKLVRVAHDRYDASRRGEAKIDSVIQTSGVYDVLANLAFTQIQWWSVGTGFKKELLFGFIARQRGTSDLYVVFRGTSSVGEWISNFKFIQQSYTTITDRDSGNSGETHWGFRRTYDRPEFDKGSVLWATRLFDRLFLSGVKPMRSILENTLTQVCPPHASPSRIFVTGHSLGGALATLATAHILRLIRDRRISAASPILYSFASPRVGDSNFAKTFKDVECYRVANSEDIVPKVPIPTFLLLAGRTPPKSGSLSLIQQFISRSDYQHVGLPIYFTAHRENVSDNHTIPIYLSALED